MKNIKVLWISPTPPYPVNAGNRRHLDFLIQHVSTFSGDIEFILYGWENEAEKYSLELRGMFDSFACFPQPLNRRMSFNNFWGIDDWVSEEFIDYVKQHTRGNKYDLVIVEYVWMSRILDLFPDDVVKVIDTHDIFTDRDKLLENQGIEKQWFYTVADEESKGLKRGDLIFGITESDCAYFEKLLMNTEHHSSAKVVHCGSGFSPENNNYKKTINEKELVFGYVASSNALNKMAINKFLENLSKRVYSGRGFHINVAGSICDHISEYENIKVYKKGFVESLSDFYKGVDVVLTPMVNGTGLKIKTIEAIENNKPFIGTKYSSNDLPVSSLWHKFSSLDSMAYFIAKSLINETNKFNKLSTLTYLQMMTNQLCKELVNKQIRVNENLKSTVLGEVVIKNSSYNICDSKHKIRIQNSDQKREKDLKVSVIIPAYNTGKFIARCLDSILSDKLEEMEIIIIDDGSSDETYEISRSYKSKDRRIKVMKQSNAGQGPARNKGIEVACGKYVYFVDSDDMLGKDSLFNMYTKSEEDNLDICSPDRPYLNSRPLRFISALPGWCCFVRRDKLDSNNVTIRQPSIKSGQDGVFSNMLLTKCTRAGVCTEAKYHYEKRDDSTFNSIKKDLTRLPQLVEQHLNVLREFYLRNNLFETQLERYLLFLQDESFKFRLYPFMSEMDKSSAKSIYLAIKSELCSKQKNVGNEAMKYFDEKFLDISHLSFEDYKKKYS